MNKRIVFFLLFIFSLTARLSALTLEKEKSFFQAVAPKSVEVSPDGQYAAVMDLEGMKILIYDAEKVKLQKILIFPPTFAEGWNYDKKEAIRSYAEKPVEGCFSSDSKYLWFSFHNDESIVRYRIDGSQKDEFSSDLLQKATEIDLQNGVTNQLQLPKVKVGKTPKVLMLTPDQKKLLVANWHSHSVSVVDPESFKETGRVKLKSWYIPRGIDITADSKTAYVANQVGGTVNVIDIDSGKVLKELRICSNPRHLILSSDENFLYLSDNVPGRVVKWNLKADRIEKTVDLGIRARTIALSPDEKTVYVTMYETDEIVALDSSSLKVLDRDPMVRAIGVSASPDGQRIWTTSYRTGEVRVYRIKE